MPTLAQTLDCTTPVSTLLRKARRLGIHGVEALISLAISRGCTHYATASESVSCSPSRQKLGDDELTVLLIIGENAYEPTAVRCAAQLARSPHVVPPRLARLVVMEKAERVLAHIAYAGLTHDAECAGFWQDVLNHLPRTGPRPEPNLPHWSRFVSMPGIQRGSSAPTCWLVPRS